MTAPTRDDVLETVDALGPPGTPVTTPEVAEGFDCTKRTIYNRLDSLAEDGVLQTKKVGANSRVWWRPASTDVPAENDPTATVTGSTFRRLFENVPGLYLIVEPEDYEIVAVSDAYLAATMTDRAEIMGKNIFDVFPADPDAPDPEGAPRVRRSLERVRAAGETDVMPVTFYPIPRTDSETDEFEDRWWTPTNAPVFDDSGELNYIIHRVEDVTPVVRQLQAGGDEAVLDRLDTRDSHLTTDIMLRGRELHEAKEAAYERLKENEQRLDAFVTTTTDLVYRMSPDWSEVYSLDGDPFIEVDEQRTERWLTEYIPEDEQERLADAIEAAVETKDLFDLEHEVFLADGTRGWARSRGVPILDDDGEIVEWFGTATNITERKRREQRDQFLLELTDAIRPLTDPVEIQHEAAHILGEWLDVARAHYAEVDEDEETFRIHADHYHSDVSSTVGEHRLSDFGEYTAETLRAGDRLVLTDYDSTEQLSDEAGATFTTLDSYANVAVPLVKNDRLVAFFAVDNATPREWTDTEIEMVEETAERTWAAVERAHAEQARRESEEKFRAVANLVPSLLWSNDPEGSAIWHNQQWLDYTGQTMEEAADDGWLDAIHPEDREQSLENFQRAVDAGEPLRQEHRIRHHDGEYRWFLVQARPVRDDGEISRWFGAATDIHDQREMRATLERLNAVTRDLLDTESATIEDRVAGLVREVLNVEYAALWRYDDQRGDLEEQAVDTAPDVDRGSVSPSTELSELVWQTFVGSDVDVATDLDGQDDTWGSLESRVLVPLGRHGVVCLGSTRAGTFDERTVDLVEMVAATVETAWDRAVGEAELTDRNEELVRLDQLNTLIREINQALVAAETREEIDDVVCERLADSDLYEFAWIGEHDPGTDLIEPRAWAGVDSGYLEDLEITVEGTPTNRDPIARAVRTGDPQVVADIATDSGFAPWREATLERGARSLVCIPLVYDDATYGVLTVYADRPQSGKDERNQDVLSELGDTIAHTMNARETRATLQTDSVVELTLRFGDADTPLSRLARETDCTVEYQGFIPRSSGRADVFFVARGVDPGELQATGADLLAFEDVRCLTEREDGSLFRVRVSDPTLAARFTDAGAVVRSITVDAGVATAVVDIPHTAAVRAFLDQLRQWNQDFELLARQSRERPLKTRQTFVAALEDRLTDRQREVLQTAYLSGFFEVPRVSNGKEVTALLGVSQPTFSEHLRAAQRRLCAVLFEGESSAGLDGAYSR